MLYEYGPKWSLKDVITKSPSILCDRNKFSLENKPTYFIFIFSGKEPVMIDFQLWPSFELTDAAQGCESWYKTWDKTWFGKVPGACSMGRNYEKCTSRTSGYNITWAICTIIPGSTYKGIYV